MGSSLVLLITPIILAVWLTWFVGGYALPVLIGLWAGSLAHEAQAGWLGSFAVFLAVAVISLWALRAAYRRLDYPPLRFALVALYCIPALAFAYNTISDLADVVGERGIWRTIVAGGGAALIGIAAFARLAAEPPGPAGR